MKNCSLIFTTTLFIITQRMKQVFSNGKHQGNIIKSSFKTLVSNFKENKPLNN